MQDFAWSYCRSLLATTVPGNELVIGSGLWAGGGTPSIPPMQVGGRLPPEKKWESG